MTSNPNSEQNMSAATKKLISRAKLLVPPMLEKFHKGQLGRVAVIGGSEDYTGAPYFSAMASARLGCDMSHVICTPTAATVIKTYSPNIMVHPLMRSTLTAGPSGTTPLDAEHEQDPDKIAGPIIDLLPRIHVLVVGPGLGRDKLMHEVCRRVLRAAREQSTPFVVDADALALVSGDPDLVRGYELAVLTPNVVEFGRLTSALGIDEEVGKAKEGQGESAKVEALAKALGGVTVVQKGAKDLISNGSTTLTVDLKGGLKRSGGQGDTLTGSIATFLGWRKAYHDQIWETKGDIDVHESVALAVFGGASITRECSRLAFAKRGRSLQASDLTEEVHTAFMNVFGEVDE
ncbi:Ribokinase-like protein [Coniochaeta ligniaria NRRL 30616]|uniref:ATP-dependent (S)-NAD(P)H-hydrate dehydratase n=1 Tax=Coniochaeta ligniaria NRRL 30616 TaxID=1408157 RepID=A0A1J7K351_9PEZI|nr:Ribokinase-like protein [Coniochaeta ligniaria NRRL 30616]